MLPAIAIAVLLQTPWDAVLKAAGVDAQAIQLSPTRWRGGGRYALKSFNASWDDWRQLEPSTLDMARRFLKASPSQAILMAAGELDLTLPPTRHPEPETSLASLAGEGPRISAALELGFRNLHPPNSYPARTIRARGGSESLEDAILACGTPKDQLPALQ
ncbi:MAG TPA: hypothetical protein VMI31_04310 [Fimbriimonadaceae bacterium]|nr:hypothetical protein [Fimbriimonadaceae bacterium]